MGLKEIGWEVVDSIQVAQDKVKWQPLVKMIINHRIP
jgi:hypothetical protein